MKKLLAFALFIPCVWASDNPTKWQGRVQLTVSSSDEIISAEVESAVRRELRSLGDISLVSKDADLTVSVIVEATKNVNGQRVGFSASVVTTTPVLTNGLFKLLKPRVGPEELQLLGKAMQGAEFPGHQWLMGQAKLPDISHLIAVTVDNDDLEPIRRQFQVIQDFMAEYHRTNSPPQKLDIEPAKP